MTRHLNLLFVCMLGSACSEAHDPSVADERVVADESAAATDPASASADTTASSGDAPGPLGVCEARDFDPSERPDDDGPTSRCRYQVLPDGVDAPFVRVMVGGRTCWLDHAPDGWTLEAEAGIVRLLGTACDEARAGSLVRIQNECGHPILSSP